MAGRLKSWFLPQSAWPVFVYCCFKHTLPRQRHFNSLIACVWLTLKQRGKQQFPRLSFYLSMECINEAARWDTNPCPSGYSGYNDEKVTMPEKRGYSNVFFWHFHWSIFMNSYSIYINLYMLMCLINSKAAKIFMNLSFWPFYCIWSSHTYTSVYGKSACHFTQTHQSSSSLVPYTSYLEI